MCWLLQSAQLWHYPTFMLPLLMLIGGIECFAGYRAWRLLLGMNGCALGFTAGLLLCIHSGIAPLLALLGALAGAVLVAMLFAMVTLLGGFVFFLLTLVSLAILAMASAGISPRWIALVAPAIGLAGAAAASMFCRPGITLVTSIGGAQQMAGGWFAYHLPPDLVPRPDVLDPFEWIAFLTLSAAGMAIQHITNCRPAVTRPTTGNTPVYLPAPAPSSHSGSVSSSRSDH